METRTAERLCVHGRLCCIKRFFMMREGASWREHQHLFLALQFPNSCCSCV
ncbi:hypothetical protein D623_10032659 [Myotis brandtii]|uniref:Uncharacterized protein n=1 Tax=Myotis brandtii TaxID=109478 RepID=S7PMC3_MYOBR|nr:hypothetical protein D623_10032659 [Myotis brandtii]